jgi:hypothetical protein
MTKPRAEDNADLTVLYRNYRDEIRVRKIRPVRWWFGKNEYHKTPGWMCTAIDLERKTADGSVVTRDFALEGFLAVGQSNIDDWRRMRDALVVAARG